jgi:REP element-mobilizing transposase RayT
MSRGDHYEDIFRDDLDREVFLKTLGQSCQSSGWVVHSFVLMRNHYHLLIETQRPTLVKGMQYLNATYTQRYNSRHRLRGHLFQGRYKALLVDGENENYFLTVSDYIHLNPVRIKKASNLEQLLKDPWNSAGWLAGNRKGRPEWLRWERIYEEFNFTKFIRKAQRHYRRHLKSRIETVGEEQGWGKIRRGWIYGSDDFVTRMKDRLVDLVEGSRNVERWRGEPVDEAEKHRAERLLQQGAQKMGYPSGSRVQGKDRYLLAHWLRCQTAIKHEWLAEKLGLETPAGMRNGIYLIRQGLQVDRDLRSRFQRLSG